MRVVVLIGALALPMAAWGWPSPWVLVCSAFAVGFLVRRPSGQSRDKLRPGYLEVPPVAAAPLSVVRRVQGYTGDGPTPPEAFGLPLERPAFGDCEGCGGS